jgi:hypothetical protein
MEQKGKENHKKERRESVRLPVGIPLVVSLVSFDLGCVLGWDKVDVGGGDSTISFNDQCVRFLRVNNFFYNRIVFNVNSLEKSIGDEHLFRLKFALLLFILFFQTECVKFSGEETDNILSR